MKKQLVTLSALCLAAPALFAQQIIPCYTDEAMKAVFDKDPAAKARYEAAQHEPVPESWARLGNNSVQATYALDTIPVVFHILHMNGPENVSDNVVYQCLAEINRVHTKTIPDSMQIDPLFQGVSGANNYVFQLATIDPNGNCTNGIIHHYDVNTNWDQSNPGYSYTGTGAGKWNPTKYLNVYVVKQIIPPGGNTGGGIVVGYTYLPGTWSTGSPADVVVYNYAFMTGTNGRSMAHEFGHWLGLPHTFGNTNSPGTCMSGGQSDDFLASGSAGAGVTDDTPKTPGAFSTCPPSSPNSCDVSNTANVQNIMDYSSCPKNFTNGQIHRMHNTMALATDGRNNVCTAANKIATGIRNPQVCVPNANFHATNRMVCPNVVITFSDSSSNARVTQWHWDFPGGTMMSGTTVNDSMPKVSYATPGLYAVSYTATSSAGGNSISKTNYIQVNSNVASYNTAFLESFETATVPGPDWQVGNTMSVLNFSVTSSAAATGTNSAWIDNFSNSAGNASYLMSTSFDISSFTSPAFSFKAAYQQQNTTDADKLQIYSSTDCGNSWVIRFTRSGATLASVSPPSGTPLIPGPSQFNTYTVNINGVSGSSNVKFKFLFTADPNGQGNDFYLDDINIFDAAVGIASIETQVALDIYPNPSSDKVNIDMVLSEKHDIGVTVTDLLGRTVETIPVQQYGQGEVKLVIAEKQAYQPGVYMANINVDGKAVTKKIVIH
jgi:PKD repeat protein